MVRMAKPRSLPRHCSSMHKHHETFLTYIVLQSLVSLGHDKLLCQLPTKWACSSAEQFFVTYMSLAKYELAQMI